MSETAKSRPVLFDHDGGVDDLLSLMMVLAMPHLDLAGIVVTPADCFLRPAMSATLKILRFFNRLDIEVSEGILHGINPFPRAWRAHAYAVDALPILNEIQLPLERSEKEKTDDAVRKYLQSQSFRVWPDPLKELKQRIQEQLSAKLDPALDVTKPDQVREQLQKLYERILAQENIILSRVERERLFESILDDILAELQGKLPSPLSEPGHEFLARKLREAETPVTILITGPVTNLAAALKVEPELSAKIEEVVWMGGALRVPGNVSDYEHDGTAEWNAYWDPPSTYALWQSQAPITLFSLDATNHVPVTMTFLHRLAQQRRYPLSDLAGQCWALTVGTLPAYEYTYFMWDTLTTGYLGGPQFMTFREARTVAIPSGPSAGRIKEVERGGNLIRVADTVDVKGFHNYLLDLFCR
jgi:purine nucleosidase